ncbi:hypothetical protein GJAV_G00074230, partial [Gymnothorax javanicus]
MCIVVRQNNTSDLFFFWKKWTLCFLDQKTKRNIQSGNSNKSRSNALSRVFSRHAHSYFKRTTQNHIPHASQKHGGCIRRGCGCWTGLPAVLSCPKCGTFWNILPQIRHCTVVHVQTCLQEEWDKTTLETIISVP